MRTTGLDAPMVEYVLGGRRLACPNLAKKVIQCSIAHLLLKTVKVCCFCNAKRVDHPSPSRFRAEVRHAITRTFNMINLSANASTMQMERICPREEDLEDHAMSRTARRLLNSNDSGEVSAY
ncbi:hypothetical protein [Bradyrhizobium liaoningense]|uniref:hypothetical protein n=1 Tax=Bradyrhizobium liaoningense TaxID=43992 RepID=UPI001BA5A3E9|nr:hypothetical protein [Bradyrhizobium liaoningense]MBR1029409.1 hypothetical protein [Bradyrhizobium liaoningense]